jgi:hypothetical protein
MPLKKVAGGYRYGMAGKTFKTKAAAERQGRAIHAAKAASKKRQAQKRVR